MVEKKKKKKHRLFWFTVKLQFFLIMIVVAAMAFYFYGGYGEQVEKLRNEAIAMVVDSDKNTFIPGRTSTVYDTNGNVLSELKGEKAAEYVEYQDIPPYFVEAMVSIEDKKFYKHRGIDYKAILRAAKAIIQDGRISQGGSTITMQLARNIYLDMDKTWQRKVKEMFIALELEKIYSKNQIMEFYLNNIYFANGYYGVGSACEGYFNCELSDLSLSQIAFLCSIPNSPTYNDPIEHFENTMKRRDRILKNMYEDNIISMADYQKALDEEIVLNIPKKDSTKKNNSVDTYAYLCATKALMASSGFEFKYYFDSDSEKEAYNEEYDLLYQYYQKKFYTEGYKIYTSINMDLQNELQASVDKELEGFKDKDDEGVYKMQGAAVTIDNETGLVVAIVGSRSQELSGYTLNRAYQSHRQPGSSIKPLLVYAPSFATGKYNPESIVEDKDIKKGPKGSGAGQVDIKYAVAHSLNSIAWQLYEELTPKTGLEYLKSMNFASIVDNDYVLATSLGGFTNGVSPLEMASAYATLENDGLYRQPTCVTTIVDSYENIIYTTEQVETVIYPETAARMMTDCMTEVFNSGTAKKLKLKDMPCAGKTGTTNSQKDGWFCGFTRYYTTAVWVGYDIPKKVDGLKGASYPGQIWKRFMEKIHKNLKPMDFLPYAKISDELEKQDSQKDEEIKNQDNQDEKKQDDQDQGDQNPDNQEDDNQEDDNQEDDNQEDDDGGVRDALDDLRDDLNN